jgi:hypothetical protein
MAFRPVNLDWKYYILGDNTAYNTIVNGTQGALFIEKIYYNEPISKKPNYQDLVYTRKGAQPRNIFLIPASQYYNTLPLRSRV